MPSRPAARVDDLVAHPTPPKLGPGPGSPDVKIGGAAAWRGVGGGAVSGLRAAKQTSDQLIDTAEKAARAAEISGSVSAPGLRLTAENLKNAQSMAMSAMFTAAAAGADMHLCNVPLPIPVHGPGLVIDGSKSVLINGLPACRANDTVLEPLGPPNKIMRGEPSVMIGD